MKFPNIHEDEIVEIFKDARKACMYIRRNALQNFINEVIEGHESTETLRDVWEQVEKFRTDIMKWAKHLVPGFSWEDEVLSVSINDQPQEVHLVFASA